MKTLIGTKAKIYSKLEDIIKYYMSVYHYDNLIIDEEPLDFIKQLNSNIVIKNYFSLFNEYGSFISSNDYIAISENISLNYNILREIGLDPIVVLKNNIKELNDYLDYLNIDYEIDSKIDNYYEVKEENKVLGYGNICNNNFYFINSYEQIINLVEEDYQNNDELDAFIIYEDEEGKFKTNNLLQELRLNNIICDTCYEIVEYDEMLEMAKSSGAKQIIKLEKDELNKGIIKVVDNLVNEEKKISEDEILEYMLGVI